MTAEFDVGVQRYGPLVQVHLRGALGTGGDPLADLRRVYPSRGGKLMRPVICCAATEALGGDPHGIARMAAALELLHNGLLVHDDIEDGSALRRGGPTLHAMVGADLAVHVGDGLLASAFSLAFLAAAANVNGVAMSAEFQRAISLTVAGQTLDLLASRRRPISPSRADYYRIVLKKTAAYSVVLPLRVAAAYAGVSDASLLLSLTRFGMYCGLAFQVQDDLRSFGSERVNGKAPAEDLIEGKVTLPLVQFLATAAQEDRGRAERFLAGDRHARSREEAAWLARAIIASGCLGSARDVAYLAAAHAKHEWSVLESRLVDGVGRRLLSALPEVALTHR